MYSLSNPVSKLHLVNAASQKALQRLGIASVENLLFYFPRDWQDLREISKIADIRPGNEYSVRAKIKDIKQARTRWKKMPLTEALLDDGSASIQAVWFNQPYLARQLLKNKEYFFHGKAAVYQPKGQPPSLHLANPGYEAVKTETIHTAGIIPLYDLTDGVTQKQLRYWLKQGLETAADLADFLPRTLRTKLKLVPLGAAIQNIHFPEDEKNLEAARKRLAFDELFIGQLGFVAYKRRLKRLPAPPLGFNQSLIKNFVSSLPWQLTSSQRLAAWEILQDLEKASPMNRLLEGDVGSGKTVVAGLAMLQAASRGWQSVLLAPTEILAFQHYQTLKELYKNTELKIILWTKSHKIGHPTSDFRLLTSEIIIGTHALLQESVKFQRIGLLIVDEQHRFGVQQRAALIRGQTQKQTLTNADNGLLYEDLTYKIRQCVFAVKKNIGLGHKEKIYQNALEQEFKKKKIPYQREKPIQLTYNGVNIGSYQPDFVIDNKVLVELKALPFMGNTEKRQIWTYLKGSAYRLALLVNFGPNDVEIKRVIYDVARGEQRKSASSPRQSAAVIPHLLSMTATPIPRTLALAFYGDLDISRLTELPKGRKKIITRLVSPKARAQAYEFMRREVEKGSQVYVVTPLIGGDSTSPLPLSRPGQGIPQKFQRNFRGAPGEGGPPTGGPGEVEIKSVTTEFQKLQKIFPELRIAMLHGRLRGEEKKQIMDDFSAGKINILVTTTVIEVGVDVPNASIMLIENAERFGLAQLHQLRGRVGRGESQSYCFLFAESSSQLTSRRLQAVVKSNDGFELAETDLKLRGPGELLGARQSGYLPFKIARLSDKALIKQARAEAEALIKEDPELAKYPDLKQKIAPLAKTAHFE